jgi:hypothetical protein
MVRLFYLQQWRQQQCFFTADGHFRYESGSILQIDPQEWLSLLQQNGRDVSQA